jgi:hypothetical protein
MFEEYAEVLKEFLDSNLAVFTDIQIMRMKNLFKSVDQ